GAGTSNTLRLTGSAFTLNLLDTTTLGKISNLQTLDLLTSAVNYTVPLPRTSVRTIAGANHTLVVQGGAGDVVQIGNRWLLGADQVIAGVTYHVYTQEDVTLKVQQGVSGAFAVQTQTLPIFAIDSATASVRVKLQDVHGGGGGAWMATAPGQFLDIAVSTYGALEAPIVFGLGVDHRIYVARFNPNGTLLDGWVTLAPGLFDALTTAYYDANAATMVFALGTAGAGGSQLYFAHFTAAGAFRDGWALVAPGQFRSLTAGSLGAGRDQPEVFGVGLDGK